MGRNSPESYARRLVRRRETAREFLKQWWIDHPCVICGETDYRVMTLDHPPGVKIHRRQEIGQMIKYGKTVPVIIRELEKGTPYCRNHHAIKEYERGGW